MHRKPPRAPTPVIPELDGENVTPATNRPQRQQKPNQWLNSDTLDLSVANIKEATLHTILEQVQNLLKVLATQVTSKHHWGRR